MKANKLSPFVMVLTLVFLAVFFTFPGSAAAKSKVVAVEGMSYNVNASMADNLKSLLGKKVSVTMISGKTITGFVKSVGTHQVHLEKLEGKDYFDALIRIQNISAIEAAFRKYQR